MEFLSYSEWLEHMGLNLHDENDQKELEELKDSIEGVTCFIGTDTLYEEAGWYGKHECRKQ